MVQTQLTLRSVARRPPGRGRRGQLRPPSQGSAHAPQAVHLQRRRRDRPAARRGARPRRGGRQLRHGAPARQLQQPGASRNGSARSAAHAFRIVCVSSSTQRFAVTVESNWPLSFKQRAVAAEETATVLINTDAPKPQPPPPPHSVSNSNQVLMFRSLHNTARAFRNTVTEARYLARSPPRPPPRAPSDLPRELQASSPRPPSDLPATSA